MSQAADRSIVSLTDANFSAEVEQHTGLVLVDMWAEWCGPCRTISPLVDRLAAEYGDILKVAKMNVDENPAVPSRFQVRNIPALLFFRDGQIVQMLVGAQPWGKLVETVNSLAE